MNIIELLRSYKPLCFLFTASLALAFNPSAFASCEDETSATDQSIVFAIDVSSSVGSNEMELQMGAYEQAILNEEVVDKLLGCGCTEVAVAFFGNQSRFVFEPTNIVSEDELINLSTFFSGLKSNSTPLYVTYALGGQTFIDSALRVSIDFLIDEENTSFRKAILVSGDGVNSSYSESILTSLKEEVKDHGIEVSALPIVVGDQEDLTSYYVDGDFVPDMPSRNFSGTSPGLSPLQPPPVGKTYPSLEAFYRQFVISEYGTINPASSYEDLEPVLTQSLKDIACMPMM